MRNKIILNEMGVKEFTTCAEYRIYMAGEHDDKSDKKLNPVPRDAMTLAELKQKSREEILGIINHAGSMDNKSDIRNMYAAGYGFSWTELDVVARYEGFVKDSGNKREVHYSFEGVEEKPPRKKDLDLQKEIWDCSKERKDWVRLPIFMLKEDHEAFKGIVKEHTVRGLEEAGQVVIFGKMIEHFRI